MSNTKLDIKSTPNDQALGKKTTTNFSKRCLWNSIDWPRAYKMVKNIRFRIFKATKRGDVKSVRRLQRLLVRSYENRLLAVREVSQINTGKKTLGLDKLLAVNPTLRGELVDLLGKTSLSAWIPSPTSYSHDLDDTHKVKRVRLGSQTDPLDTVFFPKEKEKPSSLAKGFLLCDKKNSLCLGLQGYMTGNILERAHVANIVDKCLQHVIKNALEPEWEAKFEGSSYGFRPGRSYHDALDRVFNSCAAGIPKKVWVLDCDISRCFDSISHEYVLKAIASFPDKGVIKRWLENGYLSNNVFHQTLLGTPQGNIISPLLANIALHGMQETLGIKVSPQGNATGEKDLARYGGHFVVLCTSQAAAKEARTTLNNWLSSRGLNVSQERTRITHIDQGFDFLGTTVRRFHISDEKTRLIVQPSKRSISKCRSSLKKIWGKGYGNPVNLTIRRLNAFIRAWATCFRPYGSKKIFSSLDNYMFTKAVRFTRRTHPLKSWRWRAKRYFGKFVFDRNDKWVFGEKRTGLCLLRFSWFPIQRHLTVKSDSSPCDPELAEYWKKREPYKVSWQFIQKRDIMIASQQKHVCPLCKESLYKGEKVHKHHTVSRQDGGSKKTSNVVFLHALCYQQVDRGSQAVPLER